MKGLWLYKTCKESFRLWAIPLVLVSVLGICYQMAPTGYNIQNVWKSVQYRQWTNWLHNTSSSGWTELGTYGGHKWSRPTTTRGPTVYTKREKKRQRKLERTIKRLKRRRDRVSKNKHNFTRTKTGNRRRKVNDKVDWSAWRGTEFLEDPPEFLSNYRNPCWNKSESTKRINCLPYFYIIGMPKCGTTDLYAKLAKHPDVAKAAWKEPHWWDRRRCPKGGRGLSTYLKYFRGVSRKIKKSVNKKGFHNKITLEASAGTLWSNDCWEDYPGNEDVDEPQYLIAHHIKRLQPNAKFIVILRNPVDRLYSGFNYFGHRRGSFESIVEETLEKFNKCVKKTDSDRNCAYNWSHGFKDVRLQIGLYSIYMKDWLEVFSREQFYVVRLEDYAVNRTQILQEICEFLDIDDYPDYVLEKLEDAGVSNSGSRRHHKSGMSDEARELLEDFYQPYNRELAKLLDDDKYLWEDS